MPCWIGGLAVSTTSTTTLTLLVIIFSGVLHGQVGGSTSSEELQEFLGSFLIDNSLGESFIDHLIAAKYIFKSGRK